MSQGIFPYTVQTTDRADAVTARAGLPLVIEMMRAFGLDKAIAEHVDVRVRESGYSEVELIEALVTLMASGGECFDDIDVLKADLGLCRLLGRTLPGADALRRFLYTFHDDVLIRTAQQNVAPGAIAYIPAENAALDGLAKVIVKLVHRVAAQGKCTKATIDHDATIQESHKKEALPHYKGGRGYQPAVALWVEQDLVIADEYRDGNVPAGMSNLPLIQRAFSSLPSAVRTYFFRADSACYEQSVLKWLSNKNREGGVKGTIGFTISADMTKELRALCVAVPDGNWTHVDDRSDETVACADVEFTPGDWPKDAEPLRYIAVRIRKKQGLLFAEGSDTKFLAVVSNRTTIKAPELLRWHWEKAGTIEHVHDVTKNEIGASVPPCGRFGANAAWYRLSLLTYNVLSALKSIALPSALNAARPKRLRFSVFTIAGRIASHAGNLVLHIGHEAERIAGLIAARVRLAAIVLQTV